MAHTLSKTTKIVSTIKGFFIKNLGAAFIIGFQALLLTCAGFLIQGNSALANDVAIYAYFLLVAGVILQAVSFVKDKGKREEEE